MEETSTSRPLRITLRPLYGPMDSDEEEDHVETPKTPDVKPRPDIKCLSSDLSQLPNLIFKCPLRIKVQPLYGPINSDEEEDNMEPSKSCPTTVKVYEFRLIMQHS